MTEKRFKYIRGKYKHGIHDTVKDGEYRSGYRTTYDDFDLDKLTDELNIRENRIKQLENENEQLKQKVDFYKYFQKDARELEKENEQLKSRVQYLERKIERERNSHMKQHEKWEKQMKNVKRNR